MVRGVMLVVLFASPLLSPPFPLLPRANPRRDKRALSLLVLVLAAVVAWVSPSLVDRGKSVVGAGVGGVMNTSRAKRRGGRGGGKAPRREMPPFFRDGVSLKKAEEQWATTLKWREENNMDEVLLTAPPHYDIITESFPWHLHQRDRSK